MAKSKRFEQNDNHFAYAYYRYSSHAQRDCSIEQQRIEAHAFCVSRGIKIIKEFEDKAISGTRIDRPQLQKMLKEIEIDRPAYLILWKTDRLSRDEFDSPLIKAQLRECGVQIEYVAEALPEDEGTRILLEKIYEGLAAQFIVQHKKNVNRGLRFNASNALYNGHKILGYKGKANQKYEIDEDTAVIVQKIFNNYSSGKSLQVIANELNNAGYRTIRGNEFSAKTLLHTLHNRSYIGEYRYADIIIPDGMPRLISDELFENVQRLLEQNKHNSRGHAKEVNKERGIDFWLTGKLFCGKCGDSMSGMSGTSKHGNLYYYYTCNNHRKKKCSKKNVVKNTIEDIVTNILKECLNNMSLKILIAEKVYTYYKKELGSDENYEKSIVNSIRDVDNMLDNIMRAIEKGIFNDTVQARMLELQEQKRLLQDELELEQNRKKYELKPEHVIKFLDSFIDDFKDNATRREVLYYLIEKIYVYDDKLIVDFYYSDDRREINFDEYKKYVENLDKLMQVLGTEPIHQEGSPSGALAPLSKKVPEILENS